jgi:hypothetical protein
MEEQQISPSTITHNQKKSKKGSGKRPSSQYFPRVTLKEALRVPQTIWESNSGKPFALGDLATEIKYCQLDY